MNFLKFGVYSKFTGSSILSFSRSMSTIVISKPFPFVYQLSINRPEKRNALSVTFWKELNECITNIHSDEECRCVVLCGEGKVFSAGIDVKELGSKLLGLENPDIGRRAFFLKRAIAEMQDSITAIEKCSKPILAAIHGCCIGAGVDLVSACDCRFASADAWFQVKEVELGIAADLGTLQRLPKVIGNDSLARELAYTARQMFADEALKVGFISRVLPDRQSLLQTTLAVAKVIASKSPIAVQGSKINMVYSRDHSVQEGLDFVLNWNLAMLQSDDIPKATMAMLEKATPEFAKL